MRATRPHHQVAEYDENDWSIFPTQKMQNSTTETILASEGGQQQNQDNFAFGNNQWSLTAILILVPIATFICAMFVQQLYQIIILLWNVLRFTILGTLKSILPSGILPRKSVQGKLMLITGSGSGLGRLMAIEFGKLGARIALWDINPEMNAETKEMLDRLGVESKAYQIDLSDRKQIYIVAAEVKRDMGDVDILVNNAGIVSGKKLFECPDELMEKTMAINCNALFFTTKAFLPAMMEKDQGHIVNISSLAGVAGVCGLVDYCASKHGAVGFSEALRSELLSLGRQITVTTVCPFYINTGMFDGVKTFSPRLFPILKPEYVVQRILEAVLTDADELFLPWCANLVLALKGLLPTKAANVIGDYFGFNRTMDTWKGREGPVVAMNGKGIANGIH